MTNNPVTAWVATIPGLLSDRTPLMDALSFVNAEIARMQNVRTSLTDALFPPTGDRVIEPATGAPVPEWFIENMREKQRKCGAAARKYPGSPKAERALSDSQLLGELLEQAGEGENGAAS